jgi:hypothetical protein
MGGPFMIHFYHQVGNGPQQGKVKMAKYNMSKSSAKIEKHSASNRPAVEVAGLVYVGKALRSKFNPGNKVTIVCRETEDGLASITVKDPNGHKAPERFLREDLYGFTA